VKEAIYSLDAEMSALGAIWLQPTIEKSRKAAARIETRDFYIPMHGKLFECFTDLLKRGIALDMVTVPAWFDKPTAVGKMQETIESVGGLDYLMQVLESCPTAHNADHYTGIVSELAFRRRLREVGESFAKTIVTSEGDPGELYSQALKSLTECKPSGGSEMVDLANLKDFGKPHGVPTHLAKLNNLTGCGGLPKGQTTVVAARKKVGKSAALVSFACNAAKIGLRVGYYTIADLDARGIKDRIVQQETGWGERPYAPEKRQEYDAVLSEIDTIWDLGVRDLQTGASSYVEDLCVVIDRDHDKKRFDLVCIDYAQKLRSRQTFERTPAQEIASGMVAELASQCGFACAIGSQTNKEGQTSHSQEWENDCGLCVQFTRPDLEREPVEIDVTYNRFGPAGSFDGTWDSYRLMVKE
jgi:replicative DNA helicase